MESTMQAIVWYGGSDLRREVVPPPVAPPGPAVVNVTLAGVCGSDLHPIRGHHGPRRPPLILGHEVVGTVDGSDERYAVCPLATCCAGAARRRRRLLPPWRGAPDVRRTIVVEPLASSVTPLRIDNMRAGDRILVIGCG